MSHTDKPSSANRHRRAGHVLFNETVESNIRYGRRDATSEEIREAARNALR